MRGVKHYGKNIVTIVKNCGTINLKFLALEIFYLKCFIELFEILFVRILDLPPKILCRNHLLGEHRELHAIWIVITEKKKGYSKHPETLRWIGKLDAMYRRHEDLVIEIISRGYAHKSPLDKRKAVGNPKQEEFIDSKTKQIQILKQKGCDCKT